MNKNIKALASAKAKKYGGEDSAEYRRGRGAKPYRTERVSQTETSEMGTYKPWSGHDSDGGVIGGVDKATYNADNKALSATYGREVQEDKKFYGSMGVPSTVAGKYSISNINQNRDMVVKPSSARVLGRKKAQQMENKAWKMSEGNMGNAKVDWKGIANKGLTSFRRGGVSKAAGESNYRSWRDDLGGR